MAVEESTPTAKPEQSTPTSGPFDLSDVPAEANRNLLDLGSLRVPAVQGMQIRLENSNNGQGAHAVVLAVGGSSLELRAFAAPRTAGIWEDIRADIIAELEKAGARHQEISGSNGVEILAYLPVEGAQGVNEVPVRFVGVDGPRWFLRGVFNGPSATDQKAAQPLQKIFKGTVVVRGDEAKPPREVLELQMPRIARSKQTEQSDVSLTESTIAED